MEVMKYNLGIAGIQEVKEADEDGWKCETMYFLWKRKPGPQL
jgi:hypothetical protein